VPIHPTQTLARLVEQGEGVCEAVLPVGLRIGRSSSKDHIPIMSSSSGNNTNNNQSNHANTEMGGGAIEGMDAVRDYQAANHTDDDTLTEAEKQMREEELSFYSNSENGDGDDNIWGLLSGAGGNIYEWYVCFRFGFFLADASANNRKGKTHPAVCALDDDDFCIYFEKDE
jgi:hypothetical protein